MKFTGKKPVEAITITELLEEVDRKEQECQAIQLKLMKSENLVKALEYEITDWRARFQRVVNALCALAESRS